MNINYLLVLLVLLLAAIANLVWADEGVDITDPIQISVIT